MTFFNHCTQYWGNQSRAISTSSPKWKTSVFCVVQRPLVAESRSYKFKRVESREYQSGIITTCTIFDSKQQHNRLISIHIMQTKENAFLNHLHTSRWICIPIQTTIYMQICPGSRWAQAIRGNSFARKPICPFFFFLPIWIKSRQQLWV